MLISSIEKFKAARALLTSVITDAEKQAAYMPDEPKYYKPYAEHNKITAIRKLLLEAKSEAVKGEGESW